jgi:energy-coupling factor transporter ATP-binding protein EcfA2
MVIAATSGVAFVRTLQLALLFNLFAFALLIFEKPIWKPRLLIAVAISNFCLIVLSNSFFADGHSVFTFSRTGFDRGVIAGLNRNAMLLISFGWYSSLRSIDDVLESFRIFQKLGKERFLFAFLRWMQMTTVEMRTHVNSLIVRGFPASTLSFRKRGFQMKVVLNAAIARLFRGVGRLTYNGESHFQYFARDKSSRNQLCATNLRAGLLYGIDTINNINLIAASGQVLLIHGASGSGKTTLLKTLAGYIPRISGWSVDGVVKLNDISLNSFESIAGIAKYIRYIGPSPKHHFIGLTVKHELMALTQNRELALASAEALGIKNLWERDVTKLSGGEQIRLLLAGGILSGAAFLLFDSPLTHLDKEGRIAFFDCLEKVSKTDQVGIIITDDSVAPYLGRIHRFHYLSNGGLADCVGCCIDDQAKGSVAFAKRSAPATAVLAELNGVNVSLDGRSVLKDVEFKIVEGECVGILGKNGSGKSTLAMTIAGLIRPSKGNVHLRGGHCGFVFQDTEDQVLGRTCKEELGIGPKLNHWTSQKTNAYIAECLSELDLDSEACTLDLHPYDLRRLCIYAAFPMGEVLILDEPSVEMDAEGILWLHAFIQRAIAMSKAVLLITHDARLVQMMTRAALIEDGSICEQNLTEEQALNYLI